VDTQKNIAKREVITYKYYQFSSKNLSKKLAQRATNQFRRYLQRKTHQASLHHGSSVTLIGTLTILSGVILLVLTALFGHFTIVAPKRLKKMT
jgi:uncharacterized protein YaaW (UPF0174 family)